MLKTEPVHLSAFPSAIPLATILLLWATEGESKRREGEEEELEALEEEESTPIRPAVALLARMLLLSMTLLSAAAAAAVAAVAVEAKAEEG